MKVMVPPACSTSVLFTLLTMFELKPAAAVLLTPRSLAPQTLTDWEAVCPVSVMVAVLGNVPQVAVGAVMVREYVKVVEAAGELMVPRLPLNESVTVNEPKV